MIEHHAQERQAHWLEMARADLPDWLRNQKRQRIAMLTRVLNGHASDIVGYEAKKIAGLFSERRAKEVDRGEV